VVSLQNYKKIFNENDREALDPATEASSSKEELYSIFLQRIKEILPRT
jgi:hypothetical protein